MPEKCPFVSVIIPVYHDWERLGLALSALERQTWPCNRFEIIVVNNDPAEPFPAESQALRHARITTEAQPGSYAARNKGIRISRGDVLGFCDADCIPAPRWIENGVHYLLENQGCFRVAGRIALIYGNRRKPTYAQMHESIFAFRQDFYSSQGVSTTANMFSWRQVFEEIGMFNEELLSGGDLEWGKRASKAGFKIGYSEEVLVCHPARDSMKALMAKARRVCSGYILLNDADFRKHPFNAIYHGLCMMKPPIKGGRLIFSQNDLPLRDRVIVYLLEYFLKLVQFREYIRCQATKKNASGNAEI